MDDDTMAPGQNPLDDDMDMKEEEKKEESGDEKATGDDSEEV